MFDPDTARRERCEITPTLEESLYRHNFNLHELTLICLTLTLLSVKSEWCTLGNAWVAAGRQITELSPNENYPQIIPHSELSSNYLRIAGTQTRANAVVLVLSHEIFIISCFKPLSVAAWWGLNMKVIWHWIHWWWQSRLNILMIMTSILRRVVTALAEFYIGGLGSDSEKGSTRFSDRWVLYPSLYWITFLDIPPKICVNGRKWAERESCQQCDD